MMDISPASLGNIQQYPANPGEYDQFYDLLAGGDCKHWVCTSNPVTGAPYDPQMVPRGDYARVLAEFWADGPDSETPPGHWFVILNEVNDDPDLEKRYTAAVGPELGPLEWDVKGVFRTRWRDARCRDHGLGNQGLVRLHPTSVGDPRHGRSGSEQRSGAALLLGGRPAARTRAISNSSDAGDPLAGAADEHVGKIKLYAWRGPDFIVDPADGSGRCRLDTGRELVALSAADVRDAAISRAMCRGTRRTPARPRRC